MYGYVYYIKNLVNGRPYVGSHAANEFDSRYYGSGTLILRAIKKHGKENFKRKIIYRADDNVELLLMETYFIKKLLFKHGSFAYNLAIDGSSPMRGRKHKPETIELYKASRRGQNNPMFGVRMMGEKNANYGRRMSEETKKKISDANKMIRGENHGNFGAIRSRETRNKISKSKQLCITARSKNDLMNAICIAKNLPYKSLPSWAMNIVTDFRSGAWQKKKTIIGNLYRICAFADAEEYFPLLVDSYSPDQDYYRGL